jgi:hypothetical protein
MASTFSCPSNNDAASAAAVLFLFSLLLLLLLLLFPPTPAFVVVAFAFVFALESTCVLDATTKYFPPLAVNKKSLQNDSSFACAMADKLAVDTSLK